MSRALEYLAGYQKIRGRGVYLGERLDTRAIRKYGVMATSPLTIRAGQAGLAVLFRYGVVVLFNLEDGEAGAVLEELGTLVTNPFSPPEEESLSIGVDPEREERTDEDGRLWLTTATVDRFQVVAEALSKSIVLAYYEAQVSRAFERLEPMAKRMSGGHRPRGNHRALLTQLGEALLAQARTIGRVETSDKPELTWDDPDLDRLYTRLAREYELSDRDMALARKTAMISDTTGVFIDLIQARQTIRVEWYIVILIVVEIVLILYELFVLG
jgi:uncharacterized Rmd1/YagE family protein